MTETEFAIDMQESVFNFIELQAAAGQPFTVKAYIEHLKDSYDE